MKTRPNRKNNKRKILAASYIIFIFLCICINSTLVLSQPSKYGYNFEKKFIEDHDKEEYTTTYFIHSFSLDYQKRHSSDTYLRKIDVIHQKLKKKIIIKCSYGLEDDPVFSNWLISKNELEFHYQDQQKEILFLNDANDNLCLLRIISDKFENVKLGILQINDDMYLFDTWETEYLNLDTQVEDGFEIVTSRFITNYHTEDLLAAKGLVLFTIDVGANYDISSNRSPNTPSFLPLYFSGFTLDKCAVKLNSPLRVNFLDGTTENFSISWTPGPEYSSDLEAYNVSALCTLSGFRLKIFVNKIIKSIEVPTDKGSKKFLIGQKGFKDYVSELWKYILIRQTGW